MSALFDIGLYAAAGGYDETFSHNEDAELDAPIRFATLGTGTRTPTETAAAAEVTVLERNAADATFGWGVVLSDDAQRPPRPEEVQPGKDRRSKNRGCG